MPTATAKYHRLLQRLKNARENQTYITISNTETEFLLWVLQAEETLGRCIREDGMSSHLHLVSSGDFINGN